MQNETANGGLWRHIHGFGFVFTYMREREKKRDSVEEKGGSVVEGVIVCHLIILPLFSFFLSSVKHLL